MRSLHQEFEWAPFRTPGDSLSLRLMVVTGDASPLPARSFWEPVAMGVGLIPPSLSQPQESLWTLLRLLSALSVPTGICVALTMGSSVPRGALFKPLREPQPSLRLPQLPQSLSTYNTGSQRATTSCSFLVRQPDPSIVFSLSQIHPLKCFIWLSQCGEKKMKF